MNYYDLDIDDIPCWDVKVFQKLTDDSEIDDLAFFSGKMFISSGSVVATVVESGPTVDINQFGYLNGILTTRVGLVLSKEFGESFQRVPVSLDGSMNIIEIANVTKLIDALDFDKSRFDVDKRDTSRIIGMRKLVLRRDRLEQADIFRLKGWPLPLIVSSRVKCVLEQMNATGGICYPVQISES